jgi:hypothetical protein
MQWGKKKQTVKKKIQQKGKKWINSSFRKKMGCFKLLSSAAAEGSPEEMEVRWSWDSNPEPSECKANA